MSMHPGPVPRVAAGLFLVVLVVPAAPALAQTDYFNTDRGRPLQVQDASAIERYAFEIQLAPQLRWSRGSASTGWGIEPGLAYGLMTRTQIEFAMPTTVARGSSADLSVDAIHVAMLHALNTETLGIPALAIEVMGEVPLGDSAPSPWAGIGVALTRTLSFGRLHLNADVTSAEAQDAAHGDGQPADHAGASRWSAGIGIDRAFAVRALLIGAEVVAFRPVETGADTEMAVATGIRYQVDPLWVADAGIRRQSGVGATWSFTFGITRSLGFVPRPSPGR